MHIHNAATGTAWPAARFGSWRLWDAHVTWPYLEPQQGKWDFSLLDRYVGIAERMGVEPLLVLGLSPAWASARPTEPSGYRPGNAAEPRSIGDWQRYVTTVARRYKNRIRQYEIWNEVNDPKLFYSGSIDQMLQLSKVAYAVLKDVDPGNIVLTPNVTGEINESLALFDRYLELGGGRYADAIAYHFYIVGARGPEALPRFVARVRTIMRKHGIGDKPLWNTETGWRIANDDASPEKLQLNSRWWPRIEQGTAAAYVARVLTLAWASGVERFYWYAWDNTALGLIEPTARVQKPAARAYEQTRRWLTGKIVERCKTDDDAVWICSLRSPAGARAWMVWRGDGKVAAYAPPREWRIVNVEPLGGAAQRRVDLPGRIEVGEAPVLLMEAGYVLHP